MLLNPHELVSKILFSEQMITLYSTCMIALMGYVISQLSRLKKENESLIYEQDTKLNSIKRSALRTEYLGIYNSSVFTDEQKYGLTRDIIKSYKKLNGNHYIETLDRELEECVYANQQQNL